MKARPIYPKGVACLRVDFTDREAREVLDGVDALREVAEGQQDVYFGDVTEALDKLYDFIWFHLKA